MNLQLNLERITHFTIEKDINSHLYSIPTQSHGSGKDSKYTIPCSSIKWSVAIANKKSLAQKISYTKTTLEKTHAFIEKMYR